MRREQDLIRTLRTAATQVQRIDLLEGVAARRRSRRTRQRVRVALAAAAVVAVAGGTTMALSGEGRRAQPAATVTPSAPRFRSAAEVWPHTIAKVPARNSEGMQVHPVTALNASEVLMLAISGAPGGASRLEVYDTARGTARVLGEVPAAEKMVGPANIAVDSRYIAWSTRTDNKPRTAFWIMPRTGGTARKVGEAAVADKVALSGDSLVWSLAKGGVYRMPLTGGTPSRLPGTGGLHLTAWPWAAAYEGRSFLSNQTKAVNLETGQSYDVRLPKGAQFMRCVSHWCVGEVKGRMIVQRVDGSGLRTLPPELRIYAPRSPHGERFALAAVIEPDKNKPGVPLAVVYDMATGTMAGLGERILGTVGGPVLAGNGSSAPSLTPYWDQDVQIRQSCEKKRCVPRSYGGGKEYTLLNLAAVTG